MNRLGLGIIGIVLIGLLGYSYYYVLPFGPRLNDPDYDEELIIIIEFEDKNDFTLFIPIIYTHGEISQTYTKYISYTQILNLRALFNLDTRVRLNSS